MRFISLSLFLAAATQKTNAQLVSLGAKRGLLRALVDVDSDLPRNEVSSMSMPVSMGIIAEAIGGTSSVTRGKRGKLGKSGKSDKSGKSGKSGKCSNTSAAEEAAEEAAEPFLCITAPFCSFETSSCTSGGLLKGVATIGTVGDIDPNLIGNEANSPNTIACPSAENTFDLESVETITVSSVGGGSLEAGGRATVKAEVFADPDYNETALFYATAITADVNNTDWVLIGSMTTFGLTKVTFEVEYDLLASAVQAVRVVFGLAPFQVACPSEDDDYVDRDDLIFSVVNGNTTIVASSLKVDSLHFDLPTFECAALKVKKCAKFSNTCKWSAEDGCVRKES